MARFRTYDRVIVNANCPEYQGSIGTIQRGTPFFAPGVPGSGGVVDHASLTWVSRLFRRRPGPSIPSGPRNLV